jgi:hypothetical protein
LSKTTARTLKRIGVRNHSGHGLRVSAACAGKEAGYGDYKPHQHENAADLKDVERRQLAREARAKGVAVRANNGGENKSKNLLRCVRCTLTLAIEDTPTRALQSGPPSQQFSDSLADAGDISLGPDDQEQKRKVKVA